MAILRKKFADEEQSCRDHSDPADHRTSEGLAALTEYVSAKLDFAPRVRVCRVLLPAYLVRHHISIRQDDRIEEVRRQVGRNAVLLQRSTAGERGGVVQDTDGDVIA